MPTDTPALPVSPTTASTDSAPETTPKVISDDDEMSDYAPKAAVIHLTGLAMKRAQRCHPRGHAVGIARGMTMR